jgi:hypothetical protein
VRDGAGPSGLLALAATVPIAIAVRVRVAVAALDAEALEVGRTSAQRHREK